MSFRSCGAMGERGDGPCYLRAGHPGLHSDGDARWRDIPFNQTAAARALRAIQKYDQAPSNNPRYLLIEAETALGEILGLQCTGVVDAVDEDGSPVFYSHDGDTCPIHEWLVEGDAQ